MRQAVASDDPCLYGKTSCPRLFRACGQASLAVYAKRDLHFECKILCGWCRVKAGNWLGPSGLCSTLADMVNRVQPGGLQCRVVATSGGGAPVLCTSRSAS